MNRIDSSLYDLDLFFNCRDFLVHLATAGGKVPEEVMLNPTHQRIRSFLLNDRARVFAYKLNPYLNRILELKLETQGITLDSFDREAYLADFIFYATKGCISFDRTFVLDHNDYRYHLVAYPVFHERNYCRFPPVIKNEEFNKIIDSDFFREPIEDFFWLLGLD